MAKRYINWILALVLLGSLLNFTPAYAFHSDAFTFFVPYSADSLREQFMAMQEEISPDWEPQEIVTTISISVLRDGTTVYYDHWEDGLERNINLPTQLTTEVSPPLNAGQVIPLRSSVPVPRGDPPTGIYYDGGDKIVAVGGAIAVTYAAWPEPLWNRNVPSDPPVVLNGFGVLFAGAWELYPTSLWGTEYIIPVGENLGRGGSNLRGGFTTVGFTVQAIDDGTTVQVLNPDGSPIDQRTLDEGEDWALVNVAQAGTRVVADWPVQVHLFTGDPFNTWEARGATMLPTNLWTNDYLAPRTSDGDYWLYNPNDIDLIVQATTTSGTDSIPVPAGGVARYAPAPSGVVSTAQTGVRFVSQGGDFYGIVALDENENQDWGYALMPMDFLTTQTLVGWAPGNNNDPPNGDQSRVYVTTAAAGDTEILVDFDGDGTPDDSVTVPPLAEVDITDPSDFDMTGAFLFSADTTVPFVAVWGQDQSADENLPSIDVGTNIAPLRAPSIQKFITLLREGYNCGTVQQGHVVEFRILAYNDSNFPLDPAVIRDDLGAGITYLAGTTFFNVTQQVPDGGSTPFPLDEGGFTLPGGLDRFGMATISYQATIPLTGLFANETSFVSPSDVDPAIIEIEPPLRSAATYQITKTLIDPPSGPVDPGATVTFDVAILNTSTMNAITQLPLRDEFDPRFLTFSSASVAPTSVVNVDADTSAIIWDNVVSGGSLGPGESLNLTLSFTVNNPLPPGAASTLNLILAEGVLDSNEVTQSTVCDEASVSFRAPTPTPTPTRPSRDDDDDEDDDTPTPTRPVVSTPPVVLTPPVTAVPPTPAVLFLPETGLQSSNPMPVWPFVIFPGLGILVIVAIQRHRTGPK